jgi:hypothetical protein
MATRLSALRSRAAAPSRPRIGFGLALALIVAVGLVLRVLAARPGFLGDELYTYTIASRDSLGDVVDGVQTTENTPPLYYVLAWLSLKVTGVPELVRLPSLVAGSALIAVAGLLGRRAFNPLAGLLAATLVGISPFAIYYSSEARAYAPAALGVLLSTLLLLRALDSRRFADWAGFALAAAAAVWFHYTAFLPLTVQLCWALAAFPRERSRVLAAHAGAAALYAPWLPFAGTNVPLSEVGKFVDLYAPLTVGRTFDYALRSLVGHPLAALTRAPGTFAIVTLGVLAAILVVVVARRAARPRAADPAVLLILVALAAPAGVLLFSLFGSNIYLPRNLFVSAPAALVLVGAALASLRRAVALAGGAAVGLLLAPSALSTATGDLARPAYDGVARLVDDRARASDPIIEGPIFPVRRSLEEPLRRPLVIFLTKPHPIYFSDDPAPAWRAAERAGTAFAVYPDSYSGEGNILRPRPPRGSGLVAVDRRVFEGTPPIAYVEYELRR